MYSGGLHRSAKQTATIIVEVNILLFFGISTAASLDTEEALHLIGNVSHEICDVVSANGTSESSEVKGKVDAQLTGLASRLVSIGASGSGEIGKESYQNVLRQDLAPLIKDEIACREKVFASLRAIVSGARDSTLSTSQENPSIQKNASPAQKGQASGKKISRRPPVGDQPHSVIDFGGAPVPPAPLHRKKQPTDDDEGVIIIVPDKSQR